MMMSIKKNNKFKYAVVFMTAIIIAILLSALYIQVQYSPVASQDETIIKVVIPEQSTAAQIGKLLKKEQLIRSEFVYNYYLRNNELATKLKPGQYSFNRSQSMQEIIKMIAEGKTDQSIFTIPEGYTVEKIGKLLVSKEIIADYQLWEQGLHQSYDDDFLPRLNPRQKLPLEGYLFPDTYMVSGSTSPEDIINMMLKNFEQKWQNQFAAMAQQQNMSMEKAIIIASMVEREAQKADERRTISGVIKNRLERGMLLQIDATVMYGLNEEKKALLYSDLEIESPYNTYKYPGLPPGPIACPGSDSIQAALNPEAHDYLYYVAKGDGSHHFSRTYQEHLNATSLYQ